MDNRQLTERVYWVDIAKAYGIILVIYGHFVLYIPTIAATIQAKFIYSFHMPLFFVIGGYFAKSEASFSKTYLISRFVKRIIPAFIFNILGLAVSFFWNLINNTLPEKQYLYGFLSMSGGATIYSLTAWFLVCLFMVEIIHSIVCSYTKTNRKLLISIAFFLSAGWLLNQKIEWLNSVSIFTKKFWRINEAMIAYAFYQIGMILKPSITGLLQKPKIYALILSCLMFLILLFTFNLNYSIVLMIASSYGNFLLFILSAIAGSFFIIISAMSTPFNKGMVFIGQNALILMLLDGFFRPVDKRIFMLLADRLSLNNQIFVFVTGVIITILFTASWLYLITLLRRFIPQQVREWIGIRSSV